jgi:subtilase family serine protease
MNRHVHAGPIARVSSCGAIIALSCALTICAAPARGLAAANRPIAGYVPAVIANGQASVRGGHDPNDVLSLNVGLGVRAPAKAAAVAKAVSTPGTKQYGDYLTNAQYMADYAPTSSQAKAARSWLASQGLDVLNVSADRLLISVRGSVEQIDRAFAVTINDYRASSRDFYSNDRVPRVPAGLNIDWVSGLNDFDVFQAAPAQPGEDFPSDFMKTYNVSGNGSGQTIGFTLWGSEVPQSDFDSYASNTGTTRIVIGQSGADGLDYTHVGTADNCGTHQELAMDTEVAHGVAPQSHLKVWLGTGVLSGTTCFPNQTIETAVDDAANSDAAIISNSWSAGFYDANIEASLLKGVMAGKTFFFATGDAAGVLQYPAFSQYAVAVGGTVLTTDALGNYSSETAWSNTAGGSGSGCVSQLNLSGTIVAYPRPSWQQGLGSAPTCAGRATPDIAAVANGHGAYVFHDGISENVGGTSLATPLWAGMSADWNHNNAAAGRPSIGFAAPLIYALANDPTTYARDFHDVTSGNNGFQAGTGWDQATGWGSPNFANLINNPADLTYTGSTSATNGDTVTLSATLHDQGAATAVSDRKVDFSVGAESCSAQTDASGDASCTVTIADSPGAYTVTATLTDAAWVAPPVSNSFSVAAQTIRLEAESFTGGGTVVSGLNSAVTSGGSILRFESPGEATQTFSGTASQLKVVARGGRDCQVGPRLVVKLDGATVLDLGDATSHWRVFRLPISPAAGAGTHTITLGGPNAGCGRPRFDYVTVVR